MSLSPVAVFKSFSKTAALIAASMGAIALIGWLFDLPALKSILPGLVSMKANTAVAILLAGLSLWLLQVDSSNHRRRLLARFFAGACSLVGSLTLIEYIFSLDLGLDQLLFREAPGAVDTLGPNRMAPNTALNFLLIGLALLLLDVKTRRGYSPAQCLIVPAGLISLLALVGYAFGALALCGFALYTKMALNTAAAFLLLFLGILFARPDRGFMAIITAQSLGGDMARRLFPAAALILFLLGWLRVIGQNAGLYDTNFGAGLHVTVNVFIFALLILSMANSLHKADLERQRANRERDQFFNLSLDMMCIAGFDGYFKQLNPAWEKTLGWSSKELCAKPYFDFVHPEDREPTIKAASNLTEGQLIITFENRYLCKDGVYRWLSWNSLPLVEEGLIFAVARDVTDQKRIQEAITNLNEDLTQRSHELESLNKELAAFSYSVSHDLRAPLRSMDGFSQALLEDYGHKLDEQGRDYLQRVRSASQRMGQLIDDLLLLSRATRAEMRREEVDVSVLAADVAGDLQQAQPDRNVEFIIQPGLQAEGDSRLLRQALENLIGNAWKFTEKHPAAKIEFGLAPNGGKPTFFVRDDGAGFDMAYSDKLFGAFQRLHSATEFEGTGIGLATVKRIVHRHGGQVWAEGAVGKGATFYFTMS